MLNKHKITFGDLVFLLTLIAGAFGLSFVVTLLLKRIYCEVFEKEIITYCIDNTDLNWFGNWLIPIFMIVSFVKVDRYVEDAKQAERIRLQEELERRLSG